MPNILSKLLREIIHSDRNTIRLKLIMFVASCPDHHLEWVVEYLKRYTAEGDG